MTDSKVNVHGSIPISRNAEEFRLARDVLREMHFGQLESLRRKVTAEVQRFLWELDADDLFQDSVLYMLRCDVRIDPKRIAGFIKTAMIRRGFDWYRRKESQSESHKNQWLRRREDLNITRREIETMWQRTQNLPLADRTFLTVYLNQGSIQRTGKALGITEWNARSRYSEIKEVLID